MAISTQRLHIDGLCCSGCTGKMHRALQKLSGVNKVITSPDLHEAEVTFDPTKVCLLNIVDSIQDAGFKVIPRSHSSHTWN